MARNSVYYTDAGGANPLLKQVRKVAPKIERIWQSCIRDTFIYFSAKLIQNFKLMDFEYDGYCEEEWYKLFEIQS